jgi:hypothetical protein
VTPSGTVPAPSAMPDEPAIEQAEALARAFATYFNAVNLAERVHRIRRRRDYQKAGAAPQPGGFEDVFARLAAEGVGREELLALLPRLHIEPVFTAHPTEAVRRALLEKEQDIVECLVADLDGTRTPQERRSDRERIRAALTAGWQTAENPPERPTVADELDHVAFYLADVLYRVLPVYYEDLNDAFATQFGDAGELPTVLRFASWVGGRHGWQSECRCRHHRGRACDPAQPDHRALPQGHRAPRQRAQPVHLARGVSMRRCATASMTTACACRRRRPGSRRATSTCRTAPCSP